MTGISHARARMGVGHVSLAPTGSRLVAAGLIVFAVFSVSCLTLIAVFRGPWIDEFWSMWMAGSDIGLREVVMTRWLNDPHPPLFSLIGWVIGPFLSDDVILRRSLNFGALILAGAYILHFWMRHRFARPFLALFTVAVLSSYPVLNGVSEYRSYFSQAAVGFALLCALYVAHCREERNQPAGFEGAAVFVTVFLALNLHYVTAFINGLAIGSFVLVWYAQGRRRVTQTWVLWSVLGGLFPAVFFLVQRQFLSGLSGNFWIDTDTVKAVLYLGLVAVRGASMNIVLLLAAAYALLTALRWRGIPTPLGHDIGFALILGCSTTVSALLLLAVNSQMPIIIDRYLNMLTIEVGAILAAAAASIVVANARIFVLCLLNAMFVTGLSTWQYVPQMRWDATASELTRARAACPGLVITAWVSDPDVAFANNEQVRQLAYASVARRHHLDVTFEQNGHIEGQAGPCGRAIWLEHVPAAFKTLNSPADLIRFLGLDISDEELKDAGLFKGESGFVLYLNRRNGHA